MLSRRAGRRQGYCNATKAIVFSYRDFTAGFYDFLRGTAVIEYVIAMNCKPDYIRVGETRAVSRVLHGRLAMNLVHPCLISVPALERIFDQPSIRIDAEIPLAAEKWDQ